MSTNLPQTGLACAFSAYPNRLPQRGLAGKARSYGSQAACPAPVGARLACDAVDVPCQGLTLLPYWDRLLGVSAMP